MHGTVCNSTTLHIGSQVFVTDKRKSKLYGGAEPFNRIRKLLMQEVGTLFTPVAAGRNVLCQVLAASPVTSDTLASIPYVEVRTQAGALLPEDRVLLVGVTSEPQACIARDGDALRSLFTLRVCVPILTRLDRQARSSSQPDIRWQCLSPCMGGWNRNARPCKCHPANAAASKWLTKCVCAAGGCGRISAEAGRGLRPGLQHSCSGIRHDPFRRQDTAGECTALVFTALPRSTSCRPSTRQCCARAAQALATHLTARRIKCSAAEPVQLGEVVDWLCEVTTRALLMLSYIPSADVQLIKMPMGTHATNGAGPCGRLC